MTIMTEEEAKLYQEAMECLKRVREIRAQLSPGTALTMLEATLMLSGFAPTIERAMRARRGKRRGK